MNNIVTKKNVLLFSIIVILIGSFVLTTIILEAVNRQSGKSFLMKDGQVYTSTSYPLSYEAARYKDARVSNSGKLIAYTVNKGDRALYIHSVGDDKDISAIEIKGSDDLFVQKWSPNDSKIFLASRNIQTPDTNIQIYKYENNTITLLENLNVYTNNIIVDDNNVVFFKRINECELNSSCKMQTFSYTVNQYDTNTRLVNEIGTLESGIPQGKPYPQIGTVRGDFISGNRLKLEYDIEQLGKVIETKTKNFKLYE